MRTMPTMEGDPAAQAWLRLAEQAEKNSQVDLVYKTREQPACGSTQ